MSLLSTDTNQYCYKIRHNTQCVVLNANEISVGCVVFFFFFHISCQKEEIQSHPHLFRGGTSIKSSLSGPIPIQRTGTCHEGGGQSAATYS